MEPLSPRDPNTATSGAQMDAESTRGSDEAALKAECSRFGVKYLAPGEKPYQAELATHRAKQKAAAAARRNRH
jgi:hypothetical protein